MLSRRALFRCVTTRASSSVLTRSHASRFYHDECDNTDDGPQVLSMFEEGGRSLVQRQAPSFEADAVLEDNSIAKLKLSDFEGKYVVLLFYPLDFTFVCPSELLAFDEARAEFQKRNAEVIGISVDSQFSHYAWKQLPKSKVCVNRRN
eukprot:TRINITY_DN112375_c0_g1_i1.p1 TRINITY_DN112375_c0_g1~~TRINITY_DN112375_c0_g1_i1.p1  ORF type:complete len:148 (-),score=12.37 TRINITY_DN112375_c0_g1_i1:412-855(-)